MMSLFLSQESYLLAFKYSCSTSWAGLSLPQSLTTQAEHFTTFLVLPSWSILHRPAHSPSFMLESTLTRGIPCSMQRAVTSFLYMGSSQFSARMQSRAWRLSSAWAASRSPRARPSAIRALLVQEFAEEAPC